MSETTHGFKLNKIFNRLIIVISIGIFAHLVFLLLTTDNQILKHLKKLSIPYILLILGLICVPWIGHSIRMVIWTNFLSNPLKLKDCFRIAVTTDLGSSITPTIIGGGPIKLGMLMNKGISPGKAGTLTLLGTLEDFMMYTASFLFACYFLRETMVQAFSNMASFIAENFKYILSVLLIIIILRYLINHFYKKSFIEYFPKLKHSFDNINLTIKNGFLEMKDAFQLIMANGKSWFLLSFSILICQWTAKFTILIVILTALGLDFDTLQMYLQQWLVYLSMIFIPTPGATGGAEASFYYIFNGEINDEFLPLIVSVWRFFTYYMILFSAVVFVQLFGMYDLRTKKKH